MFMNDEEIVCVDDAEWDINLNVTCPHCEHYFDVTDLMSMSEIPCEVGHSTDNIQFDITCPECSRDFRIEKITS